MNSIDDFFRNNLREHKVKPSERANLLFANKIEVKKKKKPLTLWYFGLAASLVLVALIGLYFSKGQKSSDQAMSKIAPGVQLGKPSLENSLKSGVEKSNTQVHHPQVANEVDRIASLAKMPKDNLSLNTKSGLLANTATSTLKMIDKPSQALVSNIEIDNADNTSNELKQLQKGKEQTLIYLTPILALNQVNTFSGGPKIVGNPNLINKSSDEEYFADDKSLLARVLDEVKSLKKGEKVDFNKLVFKPFDELSLDKEGFIVSETNQIKEKISWVRTRLNNNN